MITKTPGVRVYINPTDEASTAFYLVATKLFWYTSTKHLLDQIQKLGDHFSKLRRGKKLEERVFKKILSMDLEFFEEYQTSAVLNYMKEITYVEGLQSLILHHIRDIFASCIKVYYVATYSYTLLAVSLGFIPFKLIWAGLRTAARKTKQVRQRNYVQKNPDPRRQTFKNISLVKNFSTEEKEL